MHKFLLLGVAALAISACSDKGADTDSKARAAEMDYNAFIPMKAGQWKTKFVFTDMDVPTLGKAEKQQIMDEVAKSASSRSCLTEAEAKKPSADFFGGNGAEKCVYKAFDVSGQNVRLQLSCGMEGMGSVDMELAGVMGETAFNYDSKFDVRLPMIGKVKMQGKATGEYVGACPVA
jgi:hypothetical protein